MILIAMAKEILTLGYSRPKRILASVSPMKLMLRLIQNKLGVTKQFTIHRGQRLSQTVAIQLLASGLIPGFTTGTGVQKWLQVGLVAYVALIRLPLIILVMLWLIYRV